MEYPRRDVADCTGPRLQPGTHRARVALDGAKRRDQLDDNIAAAGITLSAAEIIALDEVSALPPEYPGWMVGFQNANRLAPGNDD